LARFAPLALVVATALLCTPAAHADFLVKNVTVKKSKRYVAKARGNRRR